MGHAIPVIFAAIDPDRLPEKLQTWHDGVTLLGELLKNREKSGMRESTSRNWWHLYALDGICEELNIKFISFSTNEVLAVSKPSLTSLQIALTELLRRHSEIPYLTYVRDHNLHDVFDPKYTDVLEQARPVSKLDAASSGFQAAIGFWSFVKSLQEAVKEAIEQDKRLFFIAPQP